MQLLCYSIMLPFLSGSQRELGSWFVSVRKFDKDRETERRGGKLKEKQKANQIFKSFKTRSHCVTQSRCLMTLQKNCRTKTDNVCDETSASEIEMPKSAQSTSI